MSSFTEKYVASFIAQLQSRNPGESEFHQAVSEVLTSVAPTLEDYPYLLDDKMDQGLV